jgi:transposase
MHGNNPQQAAVFNAISFEERVLAEHPCFGMPYSYAGNPSMAPEKFLSALLL